jgi:cell shape-determining protein MreC
MEPLRQGENFMDNIAFLLSLLQDEVQNSSTLDKENQSRKLKKKNKKMMQH